MAYAERNEPKLFYITGLHNAHAMETQAIELLTRQTERLEHYPEMEARLRQHIEESEIQRGRIEEVLRGLSEDADPGKSAIKDAIMGLGGNVAAMAHAAATDEIIKNTMANYAYEHFEMAAYKTLITMAEAVSDAAGAAAAKISLAEETAMAHWLDEHIGPTTLRFLSRTQDKAVAGR